MRSTLNQLIEICRNGEKGFAEAAEALQNSHLKNVLMQYSQQRAQFAAQLQQEVARLGGEPEDSGSIGGSLHRAWINVKSTLTGHDEHGVIAECERGEDFALDAYEDALEKELPANIRAIVEGQLVQIREAHDHIRQLETKTEH